MYQTGRFFCQRYDTHEGQTVLREAMMLDAYHLGQIVSVREALGGVGVGAGG